MVSDTIFFHRDRDSELCLVIHMPIIFIPMYIISNHDENNNIVEL